MARRTRLEVAKNDVFSHFDSLENHPVYRSREIGRILSENRDLWKLAQRTSTVQFIEFLKESGKLKEHCLKAEHYSHEYLRYSWGAVSFPELALSIKKDSYLCHGSAVFIHGLNDLVPKVWYVNQEQSPKEKNSNDMQQKNIDRAFSSKQRISNFTVSDITNKKNDRAVIVNGKNSNFLGVNESVSPYGRRVLVTDVERTLIDIVVRPIYAGGISEILEAYKQARDIVSVNTIRSYLKKMDYSYPYHQSIGYFMEKAGYKENRLRMMKDMGIDYDFYLTYGMKDTTFNKKWRLHIPRNF